MTPTFKSINMDDLTFSEYGGYTNVNGQQSSDGLTNIDFSLLNALKPAIPWYLPYPEWPTPPNGKYVFKIWKMVSFTTRVPEDVLSATFC
jgi:hypothetical protein